MENREKEMVNWIEFPAEAPPLKQWLLLWAKEGLSGLRTSGGVRTATEKCTDIETETHVFKWSIELVDDDIHDNIRHIW